MALTILAVADQVHPPLYDYFEAERWSDVDLILSAGDLPPQYLDFLCTSLNVPVLYVRGNHDAKYPDSRYAGCENIHGRIVEHEGIRIAGFEGCRRYNHSGCQYTDRAMGRVVSRVRLQALVKGAPDIILTHAPPAGYHDADDVCHRGFECFNRLIQAWKPAYFIHGHTHQHYSREMVTQVGETTVVNAFPFYRVEIPAPVASPEAQPAERGMLEHPRAGMKAPRSARSAARSGPQAL